MQHPVFAARVVVELVEVAIVVLVRDRDGAPVDEMFQRKAADVVCVAGVIGEAFRNGFRFPKRSNSSP